MDLERRGDVWNGNEELTGQERESVERSKQTNTRKMGESVPVFCSKKKTLEAARRAIKKNGFAAQVGEKKKGGLKRNEGR